MKLGVIKLRKKTKRRKGLVLIMILILTIVIGINDINNPLTKVSAYTVYQDNSVDADSDIDATANIGTDGATSFTDAQTLNAIDQIVTEGNGAAYVAGVNNENDIDNDASDVDAVADIGTLTTFSNVQGTTADSVYMNLQEGNGAGYAAGTNEDELHDAITDNNAPTDLGTYSNDANMQANDGTMNTLTEEDTGGGGGGQIEVSPTGALEDSISAYNSADASPTNDACYYDLVNTTKCGRLSKAPDLMVRIEFSSGYADLTVGDAFYAYYVKDRSAGSEDNVICPYSSSTGIATGNCLVDVGASGTGLSPAFTITTGFLTDLFDQGSGAFAIRYMSVVTWGSNYAFTDAMEIAEFYGLLSQGGGVNYEFDREFSFTGIATTNGDTETLAINTGVIGTESLIVEIWEAGAWVTVVTIVDANDNVWINTSIATWMDATTEEFRFLGGTESSDTTQNTWEIDMVLINNIKNEVLDYELNFEFQWTTADATQTNEEVSIFVGTRSGTENINVDYWTGSVWTNIGLINSGSATFNFTATALSTTYTLRFTGTIEGSDTTQTNWNVDLITLHTWTNEVLDYELQWEHQATNVDVNKDSYQLAVFGSATENIEIQTWNIAGSSWNTALTTQISTTEQWYNQTFDANALTGTGIVTWRYVGTAEAGDTVQDTLNIDFASVAGWNFSMYIEEATFSINDYKQGSGSIPITEQPLSVNVTSGVSYNIEIRASVDGAGTPVANGWILWDTDSNPAGATVLTTSFVTFLATIGAGDKVVTSIYLFLNVPMGEPDSTLTMTLEIQIIAA